MHEKMYTAFDAGDITTLKTLCHDGLLASFRARIRVRPSTDSRKWTLINYIEDPSIASTNIAFLEVGPALYQVIVKIKSVQSLDREHKNGQNMVEYLVLQRKMWKRKEDDWKIWGTVEESQVSDVLGDDALAATPAVGKQ